MVLAAVFQRSQGFPVAFRCGSNNIQLCARVTAAQQRKRQDCCKNEHDESSFSHIFLSIFSYFVGRSDFPSNRSKSAHFSCKMFDIFRVSGHFPSMKSLFYQLHHHCAFDCCGSNSVNENPNVIFFIFQELSCRQKRISSARQHQQDLIIHLYSSPLIFDQSLSCLPS